MIRLGPLRAADPQSGLDLEDTQGVHVDRFTLQWDTGSGWNPLNIGSEVSSEIFSTLAGMFWTWYRDMIAVQIWVLDWVLGMEWLSYILAPLAGLSVIVQGMVARIGLLNLMLVILAFVVGFWLIRGRLAGGFMELLIGSLIAALATGFLANPMAAIGGNEGIIVQSRNAGMDIATGFATDGESFERDADTIRNGLKGQLVDTLIRVPHQIINYGEIIDGASCNNADFTAKDVYTESVGREGAVEVMAACNEAYGEAASNPDAGTVVSTVSLLTTGFVFLLLSVVIVGGTIFAVLLLGWSAVKLLWQLPVGVVSVAARAQLFRTFASVGLGALLVAMATMFLVAWMKVLLGFYDATSGLPFLVRLYLFNTLVVAGAVFYVLMGEAVNKSLKAMADRLATAHTGSFNNDGVAATIPEATQGPITMRLRGLGEAAAGSATQAIRDLRPGPQPYAPTGPDGQGSGEGASIDDTPQTPQTSQGPEAGEAAKAGEGAENNGAPVAGEHNPFDNGKVIPPAPDDAVPGTGQDGTGSGANPAKPDGNPGSPPPSKPDGNADIPEPASKRVHDRVEGAKQGARTVATVGLQAAAAFGSGGVAAVATTGSKVLAGVQAARNIVSGPRPEHAATRVVTPTPTPSQAEVRSKLGRGRRSAQSESAPTAAPATVPGMVSRNTGRFGR